MEMSPLLRAAIMASLVAFAGTALAVGPDDPGSPCRPMCRAPAPLLALEKEGFPPGATPPTLP